MSAELPWYQREYTRRELRELVVRNGPRVAAGILGTIYLSPFLTACGESPSPKPDGDPSFPESFPSRTKLSEIIRWQEEDSSHLKELEKGVFLLGLFASFLAEGQISLSDFQTGSLGELRLPPKFSSGSDLELSPDGKRLAVLASERGVSLLSLVIFDLATREVREIYQGGSLYQPSVDWSPNGEFLIVQAFPAEVLTLTVVGARPEKGPKMTVLNFPGGKPIYQEETRVGVEFQEDFGQVGVGFSPDSQWLVTVGRKGETSDLNTRALNLRTGQNFLLFDGSPKQAAWCSENSFAAFVYHKGQGRLSLFDLANKEERVFSNMSSGVFRVLGQGKTLVFLEAKRIGVLDLPSGEAHYVPLGGKIYPELFSFSVFSANEEFFFQSQPPASSEREIYGFNLKEEKISLRGKMKLEPGVYLDRFLDPHWALLYSYPSGLRVVGPATPRRWHLSSLVSGQKIFLGEAKLAKVWATFLSEGENFKTPEKLYFFSQGRKHPVSPQTAGFFNKASQSVSPRTAEQVPESLNKLEFQGGDLVLNQGGAWYLRDGQRYQVSDLEKFQTNVQFNRQRYEIFSPILEKVPEGKNPLEGKAGFIDWDGHLVETHPEGSLLFLFLKGWKSASEDHSFPEIKETLGKYNWTEGRMGDFTYNAQKKPNGELELNSYTSQHASVIPRMPAKYLEWQIERYKKLLPWTKTVLVGHSLGGWVAFNAALNQAEAVRAVVTLDSPLKGINKTLVRDIGEKVLRRLWGDVVVNFLIGMGDDVPEEAVERQAKVLQERGVEVFTFASTDDVLVPHQVAFLENSTQKLNGLSLNLRFSMGRLIDIEKSWLNPFIVSGDPLEELEEWFNVVLSAHSTVIRHPEVLKTIAMIAGKVG